MFSDVSLIEILVYVGTVALGFVWLRSSVVKQDKEELETLAQTRGDRIADLEKQVGQLREKLDALRGEVETLHRLKAEEIGEVAALKVLEILRQEGHVG